MRTIASVLLVVGVILATGCGSSEPTLDTSSKETWEASVNRVTADMTEQEAFNFNACLMYIFVSKVKDLEQPALIDNLDEMKPYLHGKSAGEVIALAEKMMAEDDQ